MRKAIFAIVAASLLVSQRTGATGTEIVDNYYTDATFASACGWFDNNCAGPVHWESEGCQTNYRYRETHDCATYQQLSASCQEFDGTQWINVACPDETVTVQHRIHIPVG